MNAIYSFHGSFLCKSALLAGVNRIFETVETNCWSVKVLNVAIWLQWTQSQSVHQSVFMWEREIKALFHGRNPQGQVIPLLRCIASIRLSPHAQSEPLSQRLMPTSYLQMPAFEVSLERLSSTWGNSGASGSSSLMGPFFVPSSPVQLTQLKAGPASLVEC